MSAEVGSRAPRAHANGKRSGIITMSFTVDRADLKQIGFNALVAQIRESAADADGILARVVDQSRSSCVIHTGAASHRAHVMPAATRAPMVVGDWVFATVDAFGAWWISSRLTPYSEFHRIEPSGARQSLVTNVDAAFLVMGLDGDFNPRRLERYIALAKSAGVLPVVLLTKADLCPDVDSRLDSLAERLPSSIERYALNALDPQTVQCLAPYLALGQTAVLLGSSGAGKSTLTNTLTQGFTQSTGAVRASDSRGRHTTTGRHLVQIPGAACLIDTPGLRGLRLDIDQASLTAAFEDIANLAANCRFRDCQHQDEPGCAVRGVVAPGRLANYHKLSREVARDRADPLARQAAKSEIKAQQRALRALQRLRGR
jgi:ribosome biogenesis GTPase / thiamine phosphate phosphatase